MNQDFSKITDIALTPAYDGDVQLYPELMNYAGLNPFVRSVSSSRIVMFTGNMGQYLLVKGLGPTGFYTGQEKEYGEATFKKAFKTDAMIFRVIHRYPRTMGNDTIKENPQSIVIYEDHHTKKVYAMDLTRFNCTHQQFGFDYQPVRENMDKLGPKATYRKGEVLLRSPAVKDNGDYHYTVPAATIFTSDPAGTEDGIAMCRSWLPNVVPTGYGTRTILLGPDEFLTNSYGTEKEFKGLPDVGELVSGVGLMAAVRQYDPVMAVVNMTAKDVMSVDHDFDRAIYAEPNARILNIRVTKGRDSGRLPVGMDVQLEKYYRADRVFYTAILDTYCELKEKNPHGLEIDHEFNSLICDALAIVGRSYRYKNSRKLLMDDQYIDIMYRNQRISGWRIDVDYSYNPVPNVGFKFSDRHGGKGILCAIREKENMYVDELGNHVECAMDDLSTIRRLNPSRFYEQYYSAARRDTLKRAFVMAGMYNDLMTRDKPSRNDVKVHVAGMSDELVDQVYNYLLGFVAILSPLLLVKLNTTYTSVPNYKRKYLEACFSNRIELEFPPDNPISFMRATQQLREHYPAILSRLSWIDPDTGIRRWTVEKILIGDIDIMVLEKTAEDYSAVYSAKLQHYGTPARLTNFDKHSAPGRLQPNKTMCEAGIRTQSSYCGGEYVADISDAANNPQAHREMNLTILRHDTPTNIDKILDRNKIPKGGHRPKALYNHISQCAGRTLTNEPA